MENKKRTLQKMPPLKIGNVEMPNPLVLAPMAGVTDLPFRVLCKEQGAGLICMEMVSAKAILYKNKNTEDLMTIDPGEHPVSLQLFGSDPEILGQIAAQIEERPFDILDFNMGCPVPKVVNNGEGSALMKDPHLVREIVTSMVKAVKKPVTVKFRKGFNDQNINAVEFAKMAESCGVAAVAVHGRTREQYYSGKGEDPRGLRSGRNCGSWKNESAVLFRKSRLGYHPPGKRGSLDSGYRKRRCDRCGECRGTGGADRL